MGLGKFFHKLRNSSSNFFHKVDNGASNFFQKTVPDIAQKASGAITNAGNTINTGLRQVGNTLEKNSALLGDVGAGLSMAIGQPELAALSFSAGEAGQQLGSNIKNVRGRVNNAVNQSNQNINMGVSNIQNKASDARDVLANKINNADNRLAIAQTAVRNYNAGQVQ